MDVLNALIVIKQCLLTSVIKKLLKKYTKISERVSSLIVKEFDRDPVYGDSDKIKSYGDKVITNFEGKKVPEENASKKCLSLIMLDSVIRVNKKCYLKIDMK